MSQNFQSVTEMTLVFKKELILMKFKEEKKVTEQCLLNSNITEFKYF